MDRGFAALPYFAALKEANKPFVIRLNLNYKKEPLESGEWQVGTGKHAAAILNSERVDAVSAIARIIKNY